MWRRVSVLLLLNFLNLDTMQEHSKASSVTADEQRLIAMLLEVHYLVKEEAGTLWVYGIGPSYRRFDLKKELSVEGFAELKRKLPEKEAERQVQENI